MAPETKLLLDAIKIINKLGTKYNPHIRQWHCKECLAPMLCGEINHRDGCKIASFFKGVEKMNVL